MSLLVIGLACSLGGCGGGSSSKSVSSGTATSATTASYQTLIGAGIKLLSQGNSQAAEQLFQQAIAEQPNDPIANYNLGVVYQGRGDRRDALRQYDKALLANPSYTPALFNKAILVSGRAAALAIFYYRQVIRIQPHSPTALLNLGLLENRTAGLHKQAIRDLARAVRLDPGLHGRIPRSLRGELAHPPPLRSTSATQP